MDRLLKILLNVQVTAGAMFLIIGASVTTSHFGYYVSRVFITIMVILFIFVVISLPVYLILSVVNVKRHKKMVEQTRRDLDDVYDQLHN